jgi:aryl-alcohol dehydrogenase-like predicted oxidoreductase
MLQRERMELEYMPLFTSSPRGLGTTIYSPLASGVLTGKYNNGIPESSRFTVKQYAYIKENYLKNGDAWEELIGKVEKIGSIAARLDSTPAQLALAWCLKNEHVSTVRC